MCVCKPDHLDQIIIWWEQSQLVQEGPGLVVTLFRGLT